MRWLLLLHALYLAGHIAAAFSVRDWNPIDTLQPRREAPEDVAAAAASKNKAARKGTPATSSSSSSATATPSPSTPLTLPLPTRKRTGPLPFHHVRNRPALFVHALCLALALLACVRVQPEAEREFRHVLASTHNWRLPDFLRDSSSGARSGGGSGGIRSGFQSGSGRINRAAPQDAEDLIPIQRGGRRSVREIMEQDVAHLIVQKPRTPPPPPPPTVTDDDDDDDLDEDDEESLSTTTAPVTATASELSFALRADDDGSALTALLFHSLSLLLSLSHLCFFAVWSRLTDPRVAVVAAGPSTHGLPRWVARHFWATTFTAYLQLFTHMVTMYCIMRAGTDEDEPSTHTDGAGGGGGAGLDSISPTGLLSGLCMLPWFLVHGHRFAFNALLAWRFRAFFPHVGLVRRRAARPGPPGTKPPTVAERRRRRAEAARSYSKRLQQEQEVDGSSEEDGDEMDLSELSELAAFAPPSSSSSVSAATPAITADDIAAALASEAAADSLMAPSPYMQRLRNTPKLFAVLQEQQKARKREKEQAKKAE